MKTFDLFVVKLEKRFDDTIKTESGFLDSTLFIKNHNQIQAYKAYRL